jgi:hypothetical protein
MSFFEPPPPPPEPPPRPPTPEWLAPPDNVLAASFPLDLMLVRTDEHALFVHSGRAYENGFEFTLGLNRRTPLEGPAHDPMMLWHAAQRGEIDEAALRFGIAFADGRKATVFDPHPCWGDPETPVTPEIVLMQRGGGGGGVNWDFRFWVWPLPPEGPIEFVVEWPSEGIELTRSELDSAVVHDAATRVVTLWPGGGSGGTGAWTRVSS